MIAPADHLSTKDRHHLYDNPLRWCSPGIWEPPTFNARKFQKKLNRICGTSDGKPIVRLVWAWQSREFFHTEFDSLGKPTKGEHRAKYRFITVTLPNGDEVDISVPRWILEQRFEPGQYWESWQRTRYIYDPLIGRHVDKRGEPPADGWYGYLRTIAEHDPDNACCDRAWRDHRRRCWGYYREPGEKDLDILRRAIALRDADPYKHSPHEPLPEYALDELQRLAYAEAQEVKEENAQINHDGWASWLAQHGWRAFEDNPKTLAWGKYKFAYPSKQFKRRPSGIIVPE
jgi:hypothetical protein